MEKRKQAIYDAVNAMRQRRENDEKRLRDRVSLTDYRALTRRTEEGTIWTEALAAALREHEIVVIPPQNETYYIDNTVTIPSNRKIEAEGAVISLTRDCTVLMLRSEHTGDGTHMPIPPGNPDENITVCGGRWEERNTKRAGYGQTGKYDAERSFFGVSTLFLFNHIRGLTLRDLTFAHTAGFSVQTGDLCDGVFEHIRFDSCYADGLHMNGGSENLWVYDIAGEVGDDLVALNMYDWQNSSVDFGPMRNVVCDTLELAPTSRYQALRIMPGTYTYDDGSAVDCGLFGAVIRNVRGIRNFKLYFQTPTYRIGEEPERGAVGSADDLYFENIEIDLCGPVDSFREYETADPVRGTFGAFEFGSNIGRVTLENIRMIRYDARYPNTALSVCGPKSIRCGDYEVFDPYLSNTVDTLILRNILINGYPAETLDVLLREISFDDVNGDGRSTASGTVGTVYWDDVRVRG